LWGKAVGRKNLNVKGMQMRKRNRKAMRYLIQEGCCAMNFKHETNRVQKRRTECPWGCNVAPRPRPSLGPKNPKSSSSRKRAA